VTATISFLPMDDRKKEQQLFTCDFQKYSTNGLEQTRRKIEGKGFRFVVRPRWRKAAGG
jgi:hypothetical protein